MPQAALAVAVWVGSSAAFAVSAAGASLAVSAAVGYAAIGGALAAEVWAVNKASQALTPKIKDPGTINQWEADPRAGSPFLMGRCAAAGNIVFNQAAGETNKFLNFATVYTDCGPAQEFEGFYANGVLVPFTADGGEGASGYYLNRMWLRTQLGQASEPYLHWTATGSKDTPANHGGMPAEWTSAHRLSGFAASLWALEYDTKRYASGVPAPRMVGKWVKSYDPRQDSTYPGGSGTHRWNDQTTWTWAQCAYRYAISWCIGYRKGGVLTHGLGADIEEIDLPAFVHGANVSDANGWTISGRVTSTDDKWEVLKAILQAGAGQPILGGSEISCMVNAPSVSLVTVTDADVIGAVTVPGQVAAADRINTVWPSYTEEALDWQVVTPDAPVQVAAYVAVDREERSIELGLPLVDQATQVGQLSRYVIEDARELSGIVLETFPSLMWLKPGQCFTANYAEWGLNGQKLRILKRTRDPATKKVGFICRTETDGKHAFALGQTNTPPADPALTGVDGNVVPPPALDAWVIVGGVTANESGSLPAIVIQGEADLYDAVSIVVDYREVIDGGASYGPWQSKTFPASARELVVDGVKAGAVYQVRVRYITAKGTENPDTNTDLGTVTTGDFIAKEVLAIGGVPPSQVVQGLRDLATMGSDAAAALIKLALDASAADSAIDAKTFDSSGLPLGPVVYEQRIITATLVRIATLLGIFNEDESAYILNQLTVLVKPGQSLAQFLTYVESVLGDGEVSVSFLLEALNGVAGRIALAVQNDTEVVGLDLGVDGTTSHFDMVSSKFRFIDPAGVGPPTTVAAYGGGKWVFDAAMYVRSLIADTIETQHLKIGSVVTDRIGTNNVTVPAIASASSTVSGTGGFQSILSTTVYIPEDGTVKAVAAVAQHFPSGDHAWDMQLYIDGVMAYRAYGANAQDSVPLSGAKYCSAGTISVEVIWSGHSSTNVDYRTLDALGVMR